MNPYKILPKYTQGDMEEYVNGNEKPHLFALANRAYTRMMEEAENQSIIVSGESGSGKTEATKFLLQFLSYRSVSEHYGQNTIEDQLLQSSPILEGTIRPIFSNRKRLEMLKLLEIKIVVDLVSVVLNKFVNKQESLSK